MGASNEKSRERNVPVSKKRKNSSRKHCNVSEFEEHLEEKRKVDILRPKRTTRNVVKTMRRVDANKQLSNGLANKVREEINKYRSYNREMVTGTYDIWDPKDAPFGEKIEAEIEDARINEYYKEFTKKKSFKVPKVRLSKDVLSSAVVIPHQGASYNPPYDAHQDLLEMAIREEKKKILELAKWQKKTITNVNSASLQKSNFEEMSQGLFDIYNVDSESDVECSAPLSTNLPVKVGVRKTKQQRRRAREHKERISAIRVKKIQAYRERQALKIPQIERHILAEEARNKERKLERKQKQAIKALQPKRTHREKYKPLSVDVANCWELVGSLYKIKTKGNLAHERMKSFERRSIIETRSVGRIQSKKLKQKTSLRRNYRDV